MRRPVVVTFRGGPRDGETETLPADPCDRPRIIHTIGAAGWYERAELAGGAWHWVAAEDAERTHRRPSGPHGP